MGVLNNFRIFAKRIVGSSYPMTKLKLTGFPLFFYSLASLNIVSKYEKL